MQSIVRTASRRSTPQPKAAWKYLLGFVALAGTLLMLAGTGIGATSASKPIDANVLATISLSDPSALEAAPAPSAGATWTSGTPDILDFGSLLPGTTGEASVTWTVTTTSTSGYTLTLSNTGTAPLMQAGANSIADMSTTPTDRTTLMGTTQMGVSAGDRVGHAQTAVNYAGTPWGTTGGAGTQGELYRNVPVAGMTVAQQAAGPVANDPVTLNFLAIHNGTDLAAAGSYSGTVLLTAVAL